MLHFNGRKTWKLTDGANHKPIANPKLSHCRMDNLRDDDIIET
jgi:hypothetical protein